MDLKWDDITLGPTERLDDLQLNDMYMIQDRELFCFGMDAVLLSDFVSITAGTNLLDMCTGNGILPLLLSAKTKASHIDAIEIQETSAKLAEKNVSLNGLDDLITVRQGDIRSGIDIYGRNSFDNISANPPYINEKHGLLNPDMPKAIARHELMCTLGDVLDVGHALLKPGGHFFMVHKPHRLAEIIHDMSDVGLEPKRLRMVYPAADKEANMILIEGTKGGHKGMKHDPPVILGK